MEQDPRVFLRYLNNLIIFWYSARHGEGSKFDIKQFIFCDFFNGTNQFKIFLGEKLDFSEKKTWK